MAAPGTRRRNVRLAMGAGIVLLLGFAAWLAFGYFAVHLLWVDDQTDEELTAFVAPTEPPAGSDPDPATSDEVAPTTSTVAEPVLVSTGSFVGVEGHSVQGVANLIRNPDGTHVVQLPDLDADNGPDLVIWLAAGGSTSDIVDLGELKGNIGSQEYAVTGSLDTDRYDTVIIWCRRFSVGFGEARLRPA